MSSSVISEVILNKQSCRPTCVQFQNGELLETDETSLSCGIYTNDTGKTIPVLASETLIYTGQVVEPYVYNTFIGIRNKKKNKIKLVQINEVMLKPQPPKLREILDSSVTGVNKHALSDLNKEFGSKKIKRRTEAMERLQINVENFKDQLEKTVANVSYEDIHITETTPTSDVLPHINKSAEVATDVYTLKTLLPEGVLKSLEKPATELLAADEEQINTDASIKKQIIALQGSNDEKTLEHVSILLILDALTNIYSTTAKNIAQRAYQPTQYSRALSDFVLQTFTVQNGNTRMRPLSIKDKTCCYIIVLTLLMNNMIQLDETATKLKLTLKKLNDLCSMLHLHVKDKHAFVKIPLPATRIINVKRKAKGRK